MLKLFYISETQVAATCHDMNMHLQNTTAEWKQNHEDHLLTLKIQASISASLPNYLQTKPTTDSAAGVVLTIYTGTAM